MWDAFVLAKLLKSSFYIHNAACPELFQTVYKEYDAWDK